MVFLQLYLQKNRRIWSKDSGLTREENVMLRTIEIKQSVFESNDREADKVRAELKRRGLFLLNLMSSPGSGKTTTLVKTIGALKDEYRIGVMEADIDSDVDAHTVAEAGAKAIQLHTGGMCHLTADMTMQGLEALGTEDIDFAILENVGNLVCPAEFDLGEAHKVVILSVTEGEDKPLKYPDMFRASDVMIINKVDLLDYVNFNIEACEEYARRVNPKIRILRVSSTKGDGLDKWITWLEAQKTLASL